MTIGIALVGSGIFAKEEHLPAIQATQSLALKAVYSRSLKSAQSLSEGLSAVELYSDDQEGRNFSDLLKRDDINGVLVALPILVQPKYIKEALETGKHVLAEKPIAKDVAIAQELLSWTENPSNTSATYSVAENFRFLESFTYASQTIKTLGRILSFRVRVASRVHQGGKYYETAWRKVPEYQGGFLLDGGVHFTAAMRLLLAGGGQEMKTVSAFTAQLQPHLPPVDTLNAIIQITNGSSGTLFVSFGSTDTGSEYLVACEKGTVQIVRERVLAANSGEKPSFVVKVIVTKEGEQQQPDVKEFPNEGNGVQQEIQAWAEGLRTGKRNALQSAEEALKDLRVLEACLTSGEQGGKPVEV